MKKRPPSIAITRARSLRRNASEAELHMKQLLKAHFPAARFRFQVPILHYIADFASHRLKLVIEIDGGQHAPERDARRTRDIEAEGYAVLRFWNNEVLGNEESLMTRLRQIVGQDHPLPAPTRQQAARSAHPSPIEGERKP